VASTLIGYVRVVGQNQAMHHQGAVLGVTANPAVVNTQVISADQARAMVKRGEAQWVREDEQAKVAEPADERAARHARERQDLADEHEVQERAMLRAFVVAAETPAARAGRHVAEQNALLARGATRKEFLALLHRQDEEGKTEGARRFDEHNRMQMRHDSEMSDLQEQHDTETALAAEPPPAGAAPDDAPAPDEAAAADRAMRNEEERNDRHG